MREIKFREYRVDEWKDSGEMKMDVFSLDNDFDCECDSFGDYPLMQYTGIKDKFGKEIYEGDIVEDSFGQHEVVFREETASFVMKNLKLNYRGEVEYTSFCAKDGNYQVDDKDLGQQRPFYSSPKIIGNIYEKTNTTI
jgi:uncharacterized phage protein (TIGR01671 family)